MNEPIKIIKPLEASKLSTRAQDIVAVGQYIKNSFVEPLLDAQRAEIAEREAAGKREHELAERQLVRKHEQEYRRLRVRQPKPARVAQPRDLRAENGRIRKVFPRWALGDARCRSPPDENP